MMKGEAYIRPPKRLPLFVRFGVWFAERKTGKEMLVARLLAWYPKSAFSSGMLEVMVSHGEKGISSRILQLIRLQAAILVDCPFCIDMNSPKQAEMWG